MKGHFTLVGQTSSDSLSGKNDNAPPSFFAIDYYANNRYIRFVR
jgi:hypothetical protein